MQGEYVALKELQAGSAGYKLLQALWALEGQKIMEGLQRSAAKGNESAWRYYAGQMKGFDLAISQLDRALLHMEKELGEEGSDNASQEVEQLLAKIKKEGETA